MNDDEIKAHIRRFKRYYKQPIRLVKNCGHDPQTSIGFKISMLHFTRLQFSFESIFCLIRKKYFIEISPLLRFVLEQLCYTIELLYSENHDKVKVTKSIKSLERINKSYIRYYGVLSKYTHLDYKSIHTVVHIEDNNDDKSITFELFPEDPSEFIFFNIHTTYILLLIYFDIAAVMLTECNITHKEKLQKKLTTKKNNLNKTIRNIEKEFIQTLNEQENTIFTKNIIPNKQ